MTQSPDRTEADNHATPYREPRQSVFLSATLERFGSAETTKHRVRDLSPQGMRIDQAAGLHLGATVLVTVGQLEAVGATIVWIREDAAGVKFAKAIDPDQARGKAAGRTKANLLAQPEKHRGATVGWVADLDSPYRK
jgi:hypothetical protein